jgi:hypothetical protein
MPKYALIKNTIVLNIVEADSAFIDMMMVSEQIDTAIDITESSEIVHIGDIYVDGSFSTGLSKPAAIAKRIADLREEVRLFIESRYDAPTRMNFNGIFMLAKEDGLTNRLAYVKPLLEWFSSVISFTATVAAAIQAQSTADDVMEYQWDFNTLTTTDPQITLLGAISIPD